MGLIPDMSNVMLVELNCWLAQSSAFILELQMYRYMGEIIS